MYNPHSLDLVLSKFHSDNPYPLRAFITSSQQHLLATAISQLETLFINYKLTYYLLPITTHYDRQIIHTIGHTQG